MGGPVVQRGTHFRYRVSRSKSNGRAQMEERWEKRAVDGDVFAVHRLAATRHMQSGLMGVAAVAKSSRATSDVGRTAL